MEFYYDVTRCSQSQSALGLLQPSSMAVSPFEVLRVYHYKIDGEKLARSMISHPPKTRRLIEDMTVAVAQATTTTSLTPVPIPANTSVPPVPDTTLSALAAKIKATANPDNKNKLIRLYVFSRCALHITNTFTFTIADTCREPRALGRIRSLLTYGTQQLAFTKYGERYVEARYVLVCHSFRRSLHPKWTSTPRTHFH
jgi:hypothetical protein